MFHPCGITLFKWFVYFAKHDKKRVSFCLLVLKRFCALFLLKIGKLQAVIILSQSQPYGITLFDQFVYWTDRRSKSLLSADKYNGTSVKVVKSGSTELRDVRVFSPQRQLSRGACMNNGGCADLCLALSATERRSGLCYFMQQHHQTSLTSLLRENYIFNYLVLVVLNGIMYYFVLLFLFFCCCRSSPFTSPSVSYYYYLLLLLLLLLLF